MDEIMIMMIITITDAGGDLVEIGIEDIEDIEDIEEETIDLDMIGIGIGKIYSNLGDII